jgi:hypothetical protein
MGTHCRPMISIQTASCERRMWPESKPSVCITETRRLHHRTKTYPRQALIQNTPSHYQQRHLPPMPFECPEPHCLQLIPLAHLQSHQDAHVAERLAFAELESHRHSVLPSQGRTGWRVRDDDAQLALALNRLEREEEERRGFRLVKVGFLGDRVDR